MAIRLLNARRIQQCWRSPWVWAIAFCLLSGLILRWVRLGSKVFWYDEVFTALRVVGYLGAEVRAQLFTGEPVTAGTLLQYQTFAPDSTLGDTLRSLVDHPEHPPLFYLLCWLWVKAFGTSMAAFRGISALASSLTLLALPLLAWELFASVEAAIIAPLLFAFSPVHLLYAQEARQYALWTLVVVLSMWALQRAVRCGRWRDWGIYALCLALTFYTTVLSLFVVVAQAIYCLWVLPKQCWSRCIGAISFAGLLFSPWLAVMAVNYQRWQSSTSWTTAIDLPLATLAKLWGLHFTAVVIDPNLPLEHPYTLLIPPLMLLTFGGVLVSLWRQLPRESSLLLVAMILVPTLGLIGGDLLRDSILSKNTRYFMPALISVLVAIAGWLGLHYQHHRRVTRWGLTILLTACLINSLVIIQASTWWNKSISYHNRTLATAIATFDQPAVLIQAHGTTLGDVLSLSHYLPPTTAFVISQAPAIPQPPSTANTILLFQPTETVLAAFECPAAPLPVPGGLFQVTCAGS